MRKDRDSPWVWGILKLRENKEGAVKLLSDCRSGKENWILSYRSSISRSTLKFYLFSIVRRIKILLQSVFQSVSFKCIGVVGHGELLEIFEQGSYVIKAEFQDI